MSRTKVDQRWQAESVAKSYDAERFSGLLGGIFHRLQCRSVMRCLQGLPSDALILDLPCGTGRFHPMLTKQGFQIIGCDVSEAMLARAGHRPDRGESTRFLLGNAQGIPLRAESVDCVLSVRFAMHLACEERVKILREFARVTRGSVVVEYGYDSRWHRLRRGVRGLFLKALGRKRLYPDSTPKDRIMAEADQAGLKVCRWAWTLRWLSGSAFAVMMKVDREGKHTAEALGVARDGLNGQP